MKLTDLHQHFYNEDVYHIYTREDLIHAAYKNTKNNRRFTIPTDAEQIEDEFVIVACTYLDIPFPAELS